MAERAAEEPRTPGRRVVLGRGRDKAVRRGHPWLFSGAVARVEELAAGSPAIAEVVDAGGEMLGRGFYSERSQIRVRMVTGRGEAMPLDRDFFLRRLRAALELRRRLVPASTSGYRLVNAEGDRLPGWTVDRFGDVLVSQITSAGLEALSDDAFAALRELLPECALLAAGDVPARRSEGLDAEDRTPWGPVPETVRFREHGLAFTAELRGGQKTGFYCDQRRNRRLAEELAAGAEVLDLFAHAGAFGLYALRGGARRVVHVESSPRLVERGLEHYRLNREVPGVDLERADWVRADVFADLRGRDEVYDLVICDPPPLVRRRSARDAGARAYKDLNRLALARLAPGGLLLTFSCSGAVDARLFRQILFAAADEAGADLDLLQPLSAAADHPVSVYHPEGEYLKGWLCRLRD